MIKPIQYIKQLIKPVSNQDYVILGCSYGVHKTIYAMDQYPDRSMVTTTKEGV